MNSKANNYHIKRVRILMITHFFILSLCGCYHLLAEEPYYQRREVKVKKYLDEHYPEMEQRKKDLIVARQIEVGFTKEEVRMAWISPPDEIRPANRYGADEVWIKHYAYGDTLLYFKDGILVRIE